MNVNRDRDEGSSPSSLLVRWGVRIAGAAAAITGGLWLAFWLSGTAAAWSEAGAITVKTNTAVGLLTAGAGLLIAHSRRGRWRRAVQLVLAGFVSLLGLLTVAEHVSGYDFGIDQLLVSETERAVSTASPNRMGPAVAACLVFVGVGLLAIRSGRRRIALHAGLATLTVALVPMVGFFYGLTAFYGSTHSTAMAWPSVLGLLALGLGLVVAAGDQGPLSLLKRKDAGGALLRRIFPLAVLVPFGLGYLVTVAEQHGLLDGRTDTGALVVASILLLSVLLWQSAANLSRSVGRHERDVWALREREEALRLAQTSAHVGIWNWDPRTARFEASAGLDDLYGVAPGTINQYDDWRRLVYVEDIARIERERDRAIAEHRPFEVEFRILHSAGSTRWLLAKGGALRDEAGAVVRILGVCVDITERKQAAELTRQGEQRARERVAELAGIVKVLQRLEAERRGAEANARQERDRLLTVINSIRDEVWFVDSSRKLTLANRSAVREFRLPDGTLDAERVTSELEVLRADGTPRPVEEAPPFRALRGEVLDGVEEIVRTPAAGELRHRMVSAAPVRDASGNIIGSVSVARDITDQKRFEAALRASEERYRTIVETAGEGIVIARPDGTYLYANQRMADMLGYPASDIVGKSDLDFAFQPDQGRVASDALAPNGADVLQGEFKFRRRNGSPMWSMYSVSPIYDERGRHVANLGMHTDVTERKRAEARLATVARLYEVLSRANETMVRTRDERMLYQQICDVCAEVGGYPLAWIGEAREREVTLVAHSGYGGDYLREHELELEGGLSQGPTGVCIREDRAVVDDDFEHDVVACPWKQAALRFGFRAAAAFPLRRQRRVVGVLTLHASSAEAFDAEHVEALEALSADLSYALDSMLQERLRTEAEHALRESEQGLRDADRHKNEFMAVLSHELRNPLAPIKNSLYILERTAPGSDQAHRAQTVIERQTAQLARLVDDLLDVTRIGQNKIQLQRERLELNDLVRRTIEDHRSLFERAEIECDLEPAVGPLLVDADANRLEQVIGNLLQNAVKFSARGSRVRVSVGSEPFSGRAVVRVTDTGVGMAPETVVRLFRPFVQADRTLDRSQGGLGLGLALAKGLVELHGGEVAARSDGIGQGAEFVVRLPLAQPEVARPRESHPQKPRTARRILIIEDSTDAADTLREALELGGHEVAVAYNGSDGVARARQFRPEVVLCDVGLPGMDGYQVARTFAADQALHDVYLVALTGYALPEDQKKAADAGFKKHLAKPATLEALDAVLAGTESKAA
jgi:PAS domain S-box-containing protein